MIWLAEKEFREDKTERIEKAPFRQTVPICCNWRRQMKNSSRSLRAAENGDEAAEMGFQRVEIFKYIFDLSRIRKHWKRRQERKRNRIKQEGTAVSIAFEKILTIQTKYPKDAESRIGCWLSKKQGMDYGRLILTDCCREMI